MSRDTIGLILTFLFSIILLAWGAHGILMRKKIDKEAHFILSIGQSIAGLMGFAFLAYYIVTS